MKTLHFMVVFGLGLNSWAAEPWTLERALAQALRSNPDSRLAAHRIAAARAGLGQANAAFMPQLQFQASYIRTDNPMQVFGSILNQRTFSSALDFNQVPDVDNLNVKGLATVPLYAGGRNAAGRSAALANTEAARFQAAAVRNELAFEVARAFHTVLKTREFIQATEAGVEAFGTNLGIAQKRENAGTLLRADVLDVEVRLAQAREDLVRARNAAELAERALRNLLGIEQEAAEGFAVADRAPAVEAPETADYTGRAELAANYAHQQAAAAEVRRARGKHLPSVHAFGSLDYDYGFKYGEGGRSYTAGAMLQWDIWDGNLTRAKVREAEANLDIVQEQERKLRLAIDLEAEQARINLREARERLAVTQAVIDQAAESVELTRARFEQGLALSTQLLDADTALIGARVRRAEAEANERIAVAALRKALGLPQLVANAAGE